MLLVVSVVLNILAKSVNICEVKILSLSNAENFLTLFGIEKLALLVQKLERIPVARVMAGSNDDTAASTFHRHCHLCGRS